MRNAVEAGNINVANFVQGFSNGLSVVQQMSVEKPAKYGEEIPIDVVEKCEYEYTTTVAEQKIKEIGYLPQYINDLDPVKIKITAHVKNENAELWNINDFNNKLTDIMFQKKAIYFRAGKSIYENCIIARYFPIITNIYDIKFEIDLKINYLLNTFSEQNAGNTRIMNPQKVIGDFYNPFYNLAASEVYKGIIT